MVLLVSSREVPLVLPQQVVGPEFVSVSRFQSTVFGLVVSLLDAVLGKEVLSKDDVAVSLGASLVVLMLDESLLLLLVGLLLVFSHLVARLVLAQEPRVAVFLEVVVVLPHPNLLFLLLVAVPRLPHLVVITHLLHRLVPSPVLPVVDVVTLQVRQSLLGQPFLLLQVQFLPVVFDARRLEFPIGDT